MKSMLKDREKYLSSYLKRRVGHLWIMFAGAVLAYIAVNSVLGNHYTLANNLGAFTAWVNIGNSNWYIFSVLFLYLATYVAFRCVKNLQNAGRILLIVGICIVYAVALKTLGKESFWYNTILMFPLGMIVACEEEYLIAIMKYSSKLYLSCIGAGVAILLFSLNYMNGIMGFQVSCADCFMCLVLASMRVQLKSKVFYTLGDYAFEVFIFQRIGFMVSERVFINRYLFLTSAVLITGVFAIIYRVCFVNRWK